MKSRHCAATNAPRFTLTAGALALVGTYLLAGALPVQAQTATNAGDAKVVKPAKAKAGAKSTGGATDTKSQASYSLGVSFGTQLHGYGLGSDGVSYDRILQGLKDALAGKATAGPEDSTRVQALMQDARNALATSNKAAATKFLADNGKLPGVMTTASGLQYKIVKQGTGDAPKASDEATVNYRGTLLDGTEFDSSYKRNEPATFQVDKVIKGWQEGLQLMKPGAKFEFYIPPDLAYGAESPPPLPPNSLLKFEVELLKVKPAAAAAATPPAPKK